MGFPDTRYTLLHMVNEAAKMDLKDSIENLFKIVYLIMLIYVAYQVLRAISGGTWATENIVIAGIGIILAGMFAIAGFLINQGKCVGTLEERTKNIGDCLTRLGNDFKDYQKLHK